MDEATAERLLLMARDLDWLRLRLATIDEYLFQTPATKGAIAARVKNLKSAAAEAADRALEHRAPSWITDFANDDDEY